MMSLTTFLILLVINNTIAQWNCQDDSQCSDGLFCTSAFTCRRCMECDDLNRRPLPSPKTSCIKSDEDCGPCLESYTESVWSSRCVIPEDESFLTPQIFWLTWSVISVLISIIFIKIIVYTNVYEIVGHYVPTGKSPNSQKTGYSAAKTNVFLVSKVESIV